MKRKKKSMFKWYLSVIPILINIPLISEAQNTVSEEPLRYRTSKTAIM
ncbi:hypothetical protein BACFIN_05480 [Bacteroides finegoldii DSM 17565]|nr:hypothetical protein BACFIN_05480 [Bacteroides finegoldii DSM 17565]